MGKCRSVSLVGNKMCILSKERVDIYIINKREQIKDIDYVGLPTSWYNIDIDFISFLFLCKDNNK